MIAVVRFRTASGEYALDVERVRSVVALDAAIQPLPVPRPHVAGLVRVGGSSLPVVTLLGDDGRQLVVVDVDGERFALPTHQVTGIVRLSASETIDPAPAGQDAELVTGVVRGALLVDAAAVSRYLRRG